MRQKKVLIVDDEVIQAMAIEDLIRTWGYETCDPAVSGEEAIEKAGKELPDVVLMDISIQGEMSGIEVAGEIRSSYGIPVIFMTGYEEEYIYEKAQKVNPVAYLVKPFELEDLRTAIEATPLMSLGLKAVTTPFIPLS